MTVTDLGRGAADPTRLRGARVAVIGGGPAGLMVAERLAAQGATVSVYERMASVGRKFLLAGRGGLNLTHSEGLDQFLDRYRAGRPFLTAPLAVFGPDDLRAWCAALGQDTFIGTSGRVFPNGLRATPLLRAWLVRLRELGVELRVRHEWQGWDDLDAGGSDDEAPRSSLRFLDGTGAEVIATADAAVLALGGASWPRVGSNGAWVEMLRAEGIAVTDLRAANCGFRVSWSEVFGERFAGVPVKNVALWFGEECSRGDLIVTNGGIEGGPVYALSAPLREALDRRGEVVVGVDLFPDLAPATLAARLVPRRPKDSMTSTLRRAGFAPVAVGLVREAFGARIPADPTGVATVAKAVPITLVGAAPLDRAISTAGGVALDEVDDTMMVRARPGTFVAGEMLDWEAPTGGYLLQATFSTAVVAAEGVARWLTR